MLKAPIDSSNIINKYKRGSMITRPSEAETE